MKLLNRANQAVRSIPKTLQSWRRRVQLDWKAANFDERLAGLIAVTLPLERVPSTDVGGFTVRLSMIFGSLLIGRFFYRVWKQGLRPGFSWPETAILLFAFWNLLLLCFVDNFQAGLQVAIPTVYVLLLAVSIGRTVRNRMVPLLVALVCAGAVAAALFGIYQFVGDFAGLPHWMTAMRDEYMWQRFGFPRILSTALEPLFFSAYLLLPISLVLAYFGHSQDAAKKATLLAVGVLLIGVDVLTVSRGGILALAMLLFVTAIFIAFSGKRRAAFRYIGRLGVVVFVSLLLGLGVLTLFNRQGQDGDVTYGSRGVTTFIRHILNTHLTPNEENIKNDDSVAARSSARDYAIETVTDSPHNLLLGVGPGQYHDYNLALGKRPDLVVANVLPLDIILNTGLVGLCMIGAAVLGIFVRLLKLVKQQNAVAAALAAYLLAIGLQSLTFPTLYITHLWFAIGLGLVLLVPSLKGSRAAHNQK